MSIHNPNPEHIGKSFECDYCRKEFVLAVHNMDFNGFDEWVMVRCDECKGLAGNPLVAMVSMIWLTFGNAILDLTDENLDGDITEMRYHPMADRLGIYYVGYINEEGALVKENRDRPDVEPEMDEAFDKIVTHFNNKENTTMNTHPIIPLLSDAFVAWDVNHSWLTLTIVPKDKEAYDTLFKGFRYDVRESEWGSMCYYAHNELGMVRFFAHNKEHETGFGGSPYELELTDGTFVTIKGPWSSSPTSMMKLGFTPCDEITCAPSTSTNMTWEAMQAIIDHFCPGFTVSGDATDWADDGPEHINYRRPSSESNRIWPTTSKPLSYKESIARRRATDGVVFQPHDS